MAVNREWQKDRLIDPNKVAIYVRWSTEDQGEGTTLETQLEGCKHYIRSQEWQVNDKLIFIDDGYSGGTLKRPDMSRLREAIKKGHIDCVVVYKLDRLSRSVIDTVNLVLDEWSERTYLKSTREPIDTSNPMGKQFFYILTSFAEWERSVIRERTFSGKLQRAKEGKNPGFKAPYGYASGATPGTFVIIPEEAEIVQRIFREYLLGKGMQAIVGLLSGEGIRFRNNKPWNDSTVAHILANEFYTGRLVFGKLSHNPKYEKGGPFWLKNEKPLSIESEQIEPIISREDFEAVQSIRRSRHVIPARTVSSTHLMAGLLRCRCGHNLTGYGVRKGDNHAYYKCRGVTAKGKAFCAAGVVRQSVVDEAVIEDMKSQFLTGAGRTEVEKILYERYRLKIKELETIISTQERELRNVEEQIKRLDRDYRTGTISVERYNRLIQVIEEERGQFRETLNKARQDLEQLKEKDVDPRDLDRLTSLLTSWDELDVVEKRNVLRKWIDHVEVFRSTGSQELDLKIVYFFRQEDAG